MFCDNNSYAPYEKKAKVHVHNCINISEAEYEILLKSKVIFDYRHFSVEKIRAKPRYKVNCLM